MKKATLNLKEMPGKVIGSPAKKEKKRGGLAWIWNKITSPFSGATESEALEKPVASSREKSRGALFWLWSKIRAPFVSGAEDVDAAITSKIGEIGGIEDSAQGLASSASDAGEAFEGTGSLVGESGNVARGAEGLAEEAGSLSQQFDELAARVAARVGAEASPWIGKAIMAAVAAGVLGTGILAARHFMGNPGFKSPYGAIASGINAHPSGPNGLSNEAPTGSIGAGENTTAGANTTAGKAATTPNTGKATAVNTPTPQGGKAQNPGSLAMPSNSSFGGGAPIGESGAAPQYAAQAAQEAAMAKNAIAWSPQASVSPMSIRGGAINLGSMGFRGGKAFGGGRSLAALRNAVGYNAGMNGASYSGDAQNAINQFDNQMTSGGGISQGGITTGSADSANSMGGNTPSMMGGSGSGYGTSMAGDIANVCSQDQLSKGYVSQGGACVPYYGAPGPQQASPWQGLSNILQVLVGISGALLLTAGVLITTGWADPLFQAWQIPIGMMIAGFVAVIGLGELVMANTIAQMGGQHQALVGQMMGVATIAGAITTMLTGSAGGSWWGLVPALAGVFDLLGSLIGG